MPLKPLATEEIAELRRLYEGIGEVVVSGVDGKVEVTATEDLSEAMLRAFAACPRLLAEAERSRALLKRIEWKGSPIVEPERVCPECGADDRFGQGHVPDCELAALIA